VREQDRFEECVDCGPERLAGGSPGVPALGSFSSDGGPPAWETTEDSGVFVVSRRQALRSDYAGMPW
jgi:hypothetical protein